MGRFVVLRAKFILLRWDALASEALATTRLDVEKLVELDRRVRKEPVLGEVVDVRGKRKRGTYALKPQTLYLSKQRDASVLYLSKGRGEVEEIRRNSAGACLYRKGHSSFTCEGSRVMPKPAGT